MDTLPHPSPWEDLEASEEAELVAVWADLDRGHTCLLGLGVAVLEAVLDPEVVLGVALGVALGEGHISPLDLGAVVVECQASRPAPRHRVRSVMFRRHWH